MVCGSRKTRFSLIAVALLISGCASWSGNQYYNPSVKPSSMVQVKQTFEIPNEFARVYFQFGKQITTKERDKYTTYCSVLMQDIRAVGETPQNVLPGQFRVSKVIESNDLQPFRRTYVASFKSRFERPSNVIYTLEMRLQAAEQPGVRALICSKYAHGYGRHYPTLPEIRAALGELVTIQLPVN